MQLQSCCSVHRTLAFGTLVQIGNRENGRTTVVRIIDRGPFIQGGIIDELLAAACELSISGLTQVCLNILWSPDQKTC
jgi:rare lipoprotein A